MGFYLVEEEAYLQGISGFPLFTMVCSIAENMDGQKNNKLLSLLLMIGILGNFWILALLEALN